MDRNIDRGLDLIKAKILRLRQLLTTKAAPKQDKTKSLQTPAQQLIVETCRKKNAGAACAKTNWSEYCEAYSEYYNDCHGDYYDAE